MVAVGVPVRLPVAVAVSVSVPVAEGVLVAVAVWVAGWPCSAVGGGIAIDVLDSEFYWFGWCAFLI